MENFQIKKEVPNTLGRDTNSILFDLFKLTKRPEYYQEKINSIYELLDEEQIDKAKNQLNLIIQDLGENDEEIKRIQTHIELID